jgi:soluble lytic murein transglycosylase-like protein
LFDRRPVNPSVPIELRAAIARSAGQGRPSAGARALPLRGASTVAESLMVGTGNARAHVVVRAVMLAILTCMIGIAPVASVLAQDDGALTIAADPFAIPIAEASFRFAIPEHWIRAVVADESNNEPSAVSPKGAIGLMQVMRATYDELRTRYHLGPDPLHVRDNIIAGTAYLREMLDRFGPDGFLAAYNAGPGRYEEYLNTGRALPEETWNYVAGLASVIADARESDANSTLLGDTFDALETASADNRAASELAIPLQRIVDLTALQPSSGRPSNGDLYAAPIFVPVNSLTGAVP